MKYTLEITRRVISHDTVIRVVEAESEEEAETLGAAMAISYAMDCPEDCEETYLDCQSWDVMETHPSTDEEIAKVQP